MRYLDRNKFKFYFCTLSGLPGDLDEEIRSLGGEVFPVKITFSFFKNFKTLCDSCNINVVHSHVFMFSGFVLLLANLLKIPVRIAHFRNMHDDRKTSIQQKFKNWLMSALINQNATNILAVSEGAMASAWRLDWNTDPRCQVIYNGFDFRCFNNPQDSEGVRKEFGLSDHSKIYIHIGRMVEQKNHIRLISIFKIITDIEPNSILILVGCRTEEIELKIRGSIKKNNLLRNVVFAGERTDVPRLLKASDLMIFPSLREGLPGAVLESCASGTPVLANGLPGIREIDAQLHKTDLIKLLSIENSDQEWASHAIEMSKIKDKSAKNGSELFENTDFNLEICTKKLCDIWDKSHDTHNRKK